MLTSIYYIMGLFVLLTLISRIIILRELERLNEWSIKWKKVTKKSPKKEDFESPKQFYLYSSQSILAAFDGFWSILGLLTNNWFIFVGLFIVNSVLYQFINFFRFTYVGKVFVFLPPLIKIVAYIFMIINHFHLKWNLWALFKSLLQFQ
jgi:hypothetical protein